MSLACLAIGWNRLSDFIQLGSSTEATTQSSLRIATYNIHQLTAIPEGARAEEVVSSLRGNLQDPDIICFQEGYGLQRMQKTLGYPHMFHIGGSQGIIFSRYPMLNQGTLEMTGHSTLAGWADIAMPGDTVRLFALYLSSSRVTAESEQIMEEGNFQDKETWKEIGAMLNKYKDASARRSEQADIVAEEIALSPHPVIVCGDFNDIPQSYTYHKIRGKLVDSFQKRGRGVGTTYAGKVPWLRIDYVLIDPMFEVISHQVPHLTASDHYPVVVEIAIKDL